MTEQDNLQPDSMQDEPENAQDSVDAPRLHPDDFDVEGALAAIASLHDLTRDDIADADLDMRLEEDIEPLDIQTFERIEPPLDDDDDSLADDNISEEAVATIDETVIAASDMQEARAAYPEGVLPAPPIGALHRGQLASVIPAFTLIGIGAYLTFVLTMTDTQVSASLLIGLLIGGFGLMFIASWLSSSRWARGNLFIGMILLLMGATLAYLILPNRIDLATGYPLLLTALGTAFVVTDVVTPSERRLWFLGLLIAIVGLIAFTVTAHLIDTSILAINQTVLGLCLLLLALFLLVPLLRSRQ